MSPMAAIPLKHEVHYPESDGRPMGETEVHVRELLYLFATLDQRFRDRPDVYVGGDILLYYVEGQPRYCVCPDVLVTIGIPKLPLRRSYFLWKEGRPPSMVIEITSASSRREDQDKKEVYGRIGVAEYFLADPLGEYLKPPLQGFRLDARDTRQYRPIRPEADGSLLSEVTGLRLTRDAEGKIRLSDAVTGERLLRANELADELARLRRKLDGRSD
jgi:Uma2 family endonuclease